MLVFYSEVLFTVTTMYFLLLLRGGGCSCETYELIKVTSTNPERFTYTLVAIELKNLPVNAMVTTHRVSFCKCMAQLWPGPRPTPVIRTSF